MLIQLESGLSPSTVRKVRQLVDSIRRRDPNLSGAEIQIQENCENTCITGEGSGSYASASLHALIVRLIQNEN